MVDWLDPSDPPILPSLTLALILSLIRVFVNESEFNNPKGDILN